MLMKFSQFRRLKLPSSFCLFRPKGRPGICDIPPHPLPLPLTGISYQGCHFISPFYLRPFLLLLPSSPFTAFAPFSRILLPHSPAYFCPILQHIFAPFSRIVLPHSPAYFCPILPHNVAPFSRILCQKHVLLSGLGSEMGISRWPYMLFTCDLQK